MPKVIDLVGQRSGRLEVIEKIPGKGASRWLCRCDCGTTTEAAGYNIRLGRIKSCGCLHVERSKNATKHGQSRRNGRTPTYHIWIYTIQKCNNPSHPSYKHVGARGVKVCELWLDFTNFLADMGEKPSPKARLIRLDKSKDFEPKNCVWKT